MIENTSPTFADAFAGCGGLSLGLLRSGWTGRLAIEKDSFAFNTYRHNLVDGRFQDQFNWPKWLQKGPTCINAMLDNQARYLKAERGSVVLLAGGPPCQGFSSAGRRRADDPRNELMQRYIELVDALEPPIVLLENVRGITVDFERNRKTDPKNYAEYLVEALSEHYDVTHSMENSANYGVPQARTRFIMIAVRKDSGIDARSVWPTIEKSRVAFLRERALIAPVTARQALSDLLVSENGTHASTERPGFRTTNYKTPRSRYQRLMRDGHEGAPSDLRLANHRREIVKRFREIIARCNEEGRLNVSIGSDLRDEYLLKKHALRVLDPDRPAPTITSMPDDLLHYAEARTLTVRENARLQSFPDWFAFQGKYTTGGHLRRLQVPRFTQVANAVPPHMSEVFGSALFKLWRARDVGRRR